MVADRAEPDPAAVDAAVGERGYEVRRLEGEIPGLSANRNAGWRAAAAPLVLFTDNDTIPDPRLVAEHLAWHDREPAAEVAVLGHVRWAREVRVTPFMHWLDHGVQFDYPAIEGIEAGWGRFYGANVSAKREFLERVGGFDEVRLPYGYEDLDFGYRADAQGLRLLYNRAAVVEHLRTYDLAFYRRRVRRLARAEREFVGKHPELEPWFSPQVQLRRPPAARVRARPAPDPPREALDAAGRRARLAQRRPLLRSGAGAGLPLRLGRGVRAEVVDLPGGRPDRDHVRGELAGDDRVRADHGAARRCRRSRWSWRRSRRRRRSRSAAGRSPAGRSGARGRRSGGRRRRSSSPGRRCSARRSSIRRPHWITTS